MVLRCNVRSLVFFRLCVLFLFVAFLISNYWLPQVDFKFFSKSYRDDDDEHPTRINTFFNYSYFFTRCTDESFTARQTIHVFSLQLFAVFWGIWYSVFRFVLAFRMQKTMNARLCYFSLYVTATRCSSSPERWHTADSLICQLEEKYGSIIHLTVWLNALNPYGSVHHIRLRSFYSYFTTRKHAHTHTNEWMAGKNHMHLVRCHFAVTFLRFLTKYILPLAFSAPSSHISSNAQMRLYQDFIPFCKSNINANLNALYMNVHVSKFTASFTCHSFFDLLICNQIFLNCGFHGRALSVFCTFCYEIPGNSREMKVETKKMGK